MRVIVHKELKMYEFTDVIQVSVNVSEEVKSLKMPQETIIHIIQSDDDDDERKTKTAILCDTTTIMTVLEEGLK